MAPKAVLVGANNMEGSFDLFSPEAVGLDHEGRATNLVPGISYVVLDDEQLERYADGQGEIEVQDEARHAGAFAVRFTNPPEVIESRTT